MVERVKSIPDFENAIKKRSEEFAKEIVHILRPIRLGYASLEGYQIYPLQKITSAVTSIQQEVIKLYPDSATGEFIFKYFNNQERCISSEMADIQPWGMTDAEMDEDENFVVLTILPAVYRRDFITKEEVLLCRARVWTTSDASETGIERRQERYNEWEKEIEEAEKKMEEKRQRREQRKKRKLHNLKTDDLTL